MSTTRGRVVDAGADAVVVSNHGGRQLDRSPDAAASCCPPSCGNSGRAEVWLDSGILSGADIVAAVASGPRRLVGRAYLYGLMAGGERGVERAADILGREVRRTMQLLGVQKMAELAPEQVRCAVRPSSAWRDLAVPRVRHGHHRDRSHVEQYAFTFGGVAPLRRITPGTALRLWSDDAFCGALRSSSDLSSEKVDLRFVNPQTGPFYVEGAEPGDTLALHFVSLEPARDWGASAAIPFFGGLTSTDRVGDVAGAVAGHHMDLSARPVARNTVSSQAQHSEPRIDLPVEPMLGTVGVAPAGDEVRSSLVPERFGGNMDTPQMRAGTTCYPRRKRRGRVVLHRGRALPPGRGRGVRHRRRGSDDDDADRRADQGLGARRLAAARGRRHMDGRGLQSPARGRLAGGAGRDGHLAGRALRPAHHGRYQLLSQIARCRSRTSSTPTTAPWSRPARHCCPQRPSSTGCTATCAPALPSSPAPDRGA